MRIGEDICDTISKVKKITHIDYDIIWTDAENLEGFITCDTLYHMIEDLLYYYDVKSEEYDDLLEDLRENYRPIPYAEQVGVRDSDFY